MFEKLNERYKTISNIFEKLIQSDKFAVPNSIILHGPDVIAQYYIALALARGANCDGDKSEKCTCQNCKWICANEHPAVITCSKLDFKADEKDSKTVISIAQINAIKDRLMISSDYHRFFIFCDAESREMTEIEKKQAKEFENFGIKFPDHDGKDWVPLGLTTKTLPDAAANALLKSVEEPPANVTFVFLAENVEDMISTIVSRSQVFYVAGNSKQEFEQEFLNEMMKNYPNIGEEKAFLASEYLADYSSKSGKRFFEIIQSTQEYLKELLRKNRGNTALKTRIINDIEKLQTVAIMAKNGFKDTSVADEAGYILTRK